MPPTTELDQVKAFWNRNPLFSGELTSTPGSREFFLAFDDIKTKDVFEGNLDDWIDPSIKGKQVLDVGCGPGYWSRRVNEAGGIYTGVDLSETAVSLTRKSLQEFSQQGHAILASAESLPFESESFDVVLSEGVIHHTPDTGKSIQEIHRVLKQGGEARVSIYYRNLLLRNRLLFLLARVAMKIFGYSLKGLRRELMAAARTPDEFVRMYDGADNPIGKCYSKREILILFRDFTIVSQKTYYLPYRAWPFQFPRRLHSWLTPYFGTMILLHLRK